MERFLIVETLVIEMLVVVSLVALFARRVRVPYTVALVIAGLLIAVRRPAAFAVTPELILALFVPPLIFEAAFHVDFRTLRRNLLPILLLAVPGVLLTTLLVGVIVAYGVGLSLPVALVFGALISATDPVAVVSLFRSLGVGKDLGTIVEGESLFNDGTAIVIFNLLLALALASVGEAGATPGTAAAEAGAAHLTTGFRLVPAVFDFVRVAAGGLGVGFGLGWLIAQIIARVDEYLIETTLMTVAAFGAYLIAERFHMSGVLAVVGAGLMCGNLAQQGMSPTTRVVLLSFWEYLGFVANSLVFLLIGLQINLGALAANWQPILVAVVAVLASRLLAVYGLTAVANLIRRRGHRPVVPAAHQHVLFWGGLRGAISLALALSLPAALADAELLRVMTFGVVLFTLLVQGTTMSPLLRRLKLIGQNEIESEYERRHARLLAAQAARVRVAELRDAGLISPTAFDRLAPELDERIRESDAAQRQLLEEHPTLRDEELEDARRETLRAERAALTGLLSNGIISEETHAEMVADIDRRRSELAVAHGDE